MGLPLHAKELIVKKRILFNQNSETELQRLRPIGMFLNYMIIAVLGILITNNSTLFAQTEWAKDDGNPVLESGPNGNWDDSYIMEPCVTFDGTTYKMWYQGNDGTNNRIGYATSPDGVDWTKVGSVNPVLSAGPSGSWDDDRVGHPSVIFDGTTYKMWYRGNDGQTSRIGYAVSDDGTNWTKVDSVNPVLDTGNAGSWDDNSVQTPVVFMVDDSTFFMWYGGSDGSNTRIGLANSSDGMHWTKDTLNPVINIGTGWELSSVYPGAVLHDGTIFQMWYFGLDQSYIGRTGYAISGDGVDWTKDTLNPVLDVGASGAWDNMGAAVGAVLFDGNTYELWYDSWDGANAGAIGYANSSDSLAVGFPNQGFIPQKLSLYQNYPNPFNPVTTIHYDLPNQSDVQITIYDLMGREVNTLISESQEAGYKSIQWNATNIPSGMYFYQIRASDFVQTKKLILLK